MHGYDTKKIQPIPIVHFALQLDEQKIFNGCVNLVFLIRALATTNLIQLNAEYAMSETTHMRTRDKRRP